MKLLTFNYILGCLVTSAITAPVPQVGSPHLQQHAGRTLDAAATTLMGHDGDIIKRHAQAITTRQLDGLTGILGGILGGPKPNQDGQKGQNGQNGQGDRKTHTHHNQPVDTQSTEPKDKVNGAAEAEGRHDTNEDGGDQQKPKKGGLLGLGLLG